MCATNLIRTPAESMGTRANFARAAVFKNPNVALSTIPDLRSFYRTEKVFCPKNYVYFKYRNIFLDKITSLKMLCPTATLEPITNIEEILGKRYDFNGLKNLSTTLKK